MKPLRALCLVPLLLAFAARAAAQALPYGPVTALDGRLGVGAEIVATAGPPDDTAFFNYTDYEHNALRMLRISLASTWRPIDAVALVAELRSEDFDWVRPYAAYVRVRPFRGYAFDIQAGRIPPVFGSFGRRAYASDNPLVGYPLAHQYLTSLRPDALPASIANLLEMRGRGWLVSYPIGSPQAEPGLPLASAFRWDTGVQARWRRGALDVSGAVTAGTLGDPRAGDNNDGRQLSARVALAPVAGLVVGGSIARGEWLEDDLSRAVPLANGRTQTAAGADAEYSRDHWLVRGEIVWSRWSVPLGTGAVIDADALAAWIEGRYRLTPRVYVAARLDRLGFSTVTAENGVRAAWDAPVTRAEAVVGFYVQRNLVLRGALQHNDRDGGRVRQRTYAALQAAYWF